MEKTWTVYILRCGDDTLYTGITDDLQRRLAMHSEGKGAKYTRGRGPLTLVYSEELTTKSEALKREHVRVCGLMTIPPFDCDRDTNIQYFKKVRALYVDINEKLFHNELKCLSMGMSGDYEDAIRCGATMVRVGTAIFGARNYNL